MIFLISALSIGLVIYAGVRGLIVWAARQPYEEELWPTKGEGGPGVKRPL